MMSVTVAASGQAAAYNTLSCCSASGASRLSPQHCGEPGRSRRLLQDAETEDTDDDQIQRDDVIQQPRHDENKNAGDERDDRLKVGDADGHGLSPFVRRLQSEIRIAAQLSFRNRDFRRFHARMFRMCKIFQRRNTHRIPERCRVRCINRHPCRARDGWAEVSRLSVSVKFKESIMRNHIFAAALIAGTAFALPASRASTRSAPPDQWSASSPRTRPDLPSLCGRGTPAVVRDSRIAS